MFKSSVFVILCWNFLVLTVFHYLTKVHKNSHIGGFPHWDRFFSGWCLVPVLFVYPLMGWLADTYYGRYKTIKCGVWVMWGASILSSSLALVKFKFPTHSHVFGVIDTVVFFVLALGLSLFQANIIQFGIDQLTDASSADITSYINWYVWTFFSSELVVVVSQKCSPAPFFLVSTLLLPIFLTLTLLSDLLFSKYLVVEPVTHNPFKLLRNVLQYAMKHKYPRQRSAFTYWDDKRYSRLDLGKNKYGGPYTTEQVEDVKTFFRILLLLFIMTAFIGLGFMYSDLVNNFFALAHASISPTTCLRNWAVLNLGSALTLLVIPVYELIVYPLFSSCFLKITSRTKFKAGIACMLLDYVVHLTLYMAKKNFGKRELCVTYEDDKDSIDALNIYWLPIPKVFECFSKIWLFGSTLEFICAQSPYSMKGLLFGIIFAVCGLYFSLVYVAILPFRYHLVQWNKVKMGCGFWFFILCLSISLILATCFILMNCKYKKRQRNEDLPSEHCFAENYYDHTDSGPTIASMDRASS